MSVFSCPNCNRYSEFHYDLHPITDEMLCELCYHDAVKETEDELEIVIEPEGSGEGEL